MRTRSRHALLVATAAAVLAVAPSAARAQTAPAAGASAQIAFDEAKSLVAKGQYDAACPKFAESERLDPGPGTEFNLADCYEHIGRTATAWTGFTSLADSLGVASDAKRAAAAKKRAEKLAPRLMRLSINVASPSPGLEVKRDDDVVRSALWGSAVPVDPGVHVVAATAPKMLPWQESVTLDHEGKTVSVDVPALSPAKEPARVAQVTPAEETLSPSAAATPGHGPPKWVGFTLLGVGAAGVVVGSIFGLQALSNKSDGDAHCNPATNVCDQTGLDLHSSASTAGAVSTIGFGVGIVGLALGTYFVLTSRAPSPSRVGSAAHLGAAPWFDGRGGGGIAANGAW